MIGVFDSGVGGMTVARAIEELCPQYPLLYFGDIARSPYGSKSPEVIAENCRRNTEFLLSQGAAVIVVACNSAAAAAGEVLRRQCTVPIIDVITATVEKAAAVTAGGSRIGIIGTRATVRSKVYEQRLESLRPGGAIVSQACPLLVPLVEENWLNKRETKMIVRRYLHPLRLAQIDTLILGCTHYPLLGRLIQERIGRRVRLIDSSAETARHLKTFLEQHPDLAAAISGSGRQSRFFVSDSTGPVQQLAARIFGRPIHLEKIDV